MSITTASWVKCFNSYFRFSDNLLGFALTLSSVDLGGSPFVNFALSAAAEVPGGIVGLLLVRYCRRRRSQAAFLLLAGITALVTVLPLGELERPFFANH
ncbi:hypothetical protein HPB48_008660 [Haemaphysalis longicornis]|uniref:Uncharacterized protein n=1 Tax=Haemaphysalis longicornis TaxID=44386 RepID=A0A9J6F9R6_HAELO|nr:hypothetical protein HPB48_008660 [Haemaphysalis longicornis]